MDTETLLARYIDGEMTSEESAAFEKRLAHDPLLAARFDAWARQDAAVTDDLAALLNAAPWDGLGPAASALPIDLAARRAEKLANRRWFVPVALAASLALVALLSIPLMQVGGDPSLAALDHLPSGQSLALEDGASITAVLTFASADGRWCREYARSQAKTGGQTGIACRNGSGWQVEQEVGGAGHIPADQGQGYATVGAEESAVLDETYASLAASEPLSPQEEARLLQNGWTTPTD